MFYKSYFLKYCFDRFWLFLEIILYSFFLARWEKMWSYSMWNTLVYCSNNITTVPIYLVFTMYQAPYWSLFIYASWEYTYIYVFWIGNLYPHTHKKKKLKEIKGHRGVHKVSLPSILVPSSFPPESITAHQSLNVCLPRYCVEHLKYIISCNPHYKPMRCVCVVGRNFPLPF